MNRRQFVRAASAAAAGLATVGSKLVGAVIAPLALSRKVSQLPRAFSFRVQLYRIGIQLGENDDRWVKWEPITLPQALPGDLIRYVSWVDGKQTADHYYEFKSRLLFEQIDRNEAMRRLNDKFPPAYAWRQGNGPWIYKGVDFSNRRVPCETWQGNDAIMWPIVKELS